VAAVLGNVAEWLTALVALLALCAAGLSAFYARQAARVSSNAYLSDLKVRREAQARQVFVTVEHRYSMRSGDLFHGAARVFSGGNATVGEKDMGGWTASIAGEELLDVLICVHNRSSEVIGPYQVSAYDSETGIDFGFAVGDESAPILPDSVIYAGLLFRQPIEGHPMPSIEFRDSSGTWWRRRHFEPIEHLGNGRR